MNSAQERFNIGITMAYGAWLDMTKEEQEKGANLRCVTPIVDHPYIQKVLQDAMDRKAEKAKAEAEEAENPKPHPLDCTKDICIPPTSWFTEIGGWYRVRIPTKNCRNEEIGCGNDPKDAAQEAWRWYEKHSNRKKLV